MILHFKTSRVNYNFQATIYEATQCDDNGLSIESIIFILKLLSVLQNASFCLPEAVLISP